MTQKAGQRQIEFVSLAENESDREKESYLHLVQLTWFLPVPGDPNFWIHFSLVLQELL